MDQRREAGGSQISGDLYKTRGLSPGKSECEKCKVNADGALDGREWKSIKNIT